MGKKDKEEELIQSHMYETRCENGFGDCTDTFYCKLDDAFRSKNPCTYQEKNLCSKIDQYST